MDNKYFMRGIMNFLRKGLVCLIIVNLFSFTLRSVTEEEREEYIRCGFETIYLPRMFKLAENPQIFISYAWGEGARTDLVQRIGLDLKRVSEGSLLDIVDNPPTTRITDFVSKIASSKHVLLFGSEQYKAKWDKRGEYRSVLVEEADLIDYKKRSEINSVLGIQLNGERREDAFPEFMYQVVTLNAKEGDYYEIFKNIINVLWARERKPSDEFEKNWALFNAYKTTILSGEKDEEVERSVEYKKRAEERMASMIERVHQYQDRLQEEEEQREIQKAEDFLG
jgi:hypothetical protein